MIKADFHVHTEFSGDSFVEVKKQIERAIDIGLEYIAITDHCDLNLYSRKGWALDVASYVNEINNIKEKYKNKISVLLGIEMGLVSNLKEQIDNIVNTYDFDFVIGSQHAVNGIDIGFEVDKYFKNRSVKQAYRQYFEYIYENVRNFTSYDVYGHLDYVIRYGPDKHFELDEYKDLIEEILRVIIKNDKGIEINTAGMRKNLGYFHPHIEILKMYKELGGEIITIGSDAHFSEHIGYKFQDVPDLLKSVGFNYYTVFEKRIPKFLSIS